MDDLDLDQLLEGIQATSFYKADTTINDIDHKTISNEDDFFKFLDEPKQTISKTTEEKDDTVIDDPEDFLDWLNNDQITTTTTLDKEKVINNSTIAIDDTITDCYNINDNAVVEPELQQLQEGEEKNLVDNDDNDASLSNIAVTNVQSVDNFFDEVYGKSPIYASSQSITDIDILEVSLEDKIKSIIRSNFPDVEQLRQLIHEYGYIPITLRAQIWSLLLTESCIEDDEITHYDDSTNGIQYDKKKVIIADCNAVVNIATTTTTGTMNKGELEVVRKDMQDILLLYCQRRKVDYKSVLCRILSTLLVTGTNHRFSRAVASSCFYSIASEFLPLLNLSPTAQSLGVNLTHNWLKVLLSYHAPALVQHLDRVLPQWEEPTKEISSSQAISIAASQRGSCTLDELERELGLDVAVTSAASTTISTNMIEVDNNNNNNSYSNKATTTTIIESAPPPPNISSHSTYPNATAVAAMTRTGCIPSHWILGIFSSSLPTTESALVLDWAILNHEKYAGFYLSVALLCLYEQDLLTMSGGKIRQWFEDIETNKIDWYKTSSALPINKHTNQVNVPENWLCFVKGWLQATTAIINSTPKSFQDALSQIEQWANVAADRQTTLDISSKHSFSNQSSSHSNYNSNNNSLHGNILEPLSNHEQLYDTNKNNFNNNSNDNDDNEQNKDFLKFNGKVNLMEKFRRLSMSFQNDLNDIKSNNIMLDIENKITYIHDQKIKYSPICIWSSIEEIIPCICSNRRRATISTVNIFNFYYLHAIKQDNTDASHTTIPTTTTLRSGSTSCYLLSKSIDNQALFYFAIDCRSTTELALGQFPKAYAFDPIGLTDGEAVTGLLDAIETLASTVHICIIGVGEAYIIKQFEMSTLVGWDKKKNHSFSSSSATTNKDIAMELTSCLSEYHSKLNAVAMFFLKKSFKYISILDGGFLAAAKYLHSPESPYTLETSLVEINRISLDTALGLTCSTATSTCTTSVNNTQRANFVSSIGNLFQTMSSKNTTTIPTTAAAGSISSNNISSSVSANNATNNYSTESNSTNNSISSVSNSEINHIPETTSTTSTNTTAATTTVASTSSTATTTSSSTSDLFSSWGKKWTASLKNINKSVSAFTATNTTNPSSDNNNTSNNTTTNSSNTEGTSNNTIISKEVKKGNFVIDDNEDDGMGPKEIADTTTISINKTEREKEQALAIHKMTGLRKGDTVVINRQDLPGAVLFPSIKYKDVLFDDPNDNIIKTPIDEQQQQPVVVVEAFINQNDLLDNLLDDISIDVKEAPKIKQQIQVHRYLVVSRERFIVLDSHGGGVGSKAVVKSNRHLTELLKMTFRKKDPEFVTLYFANKETKPCQYRINKRNEFISSLQKNMERFK